MMQKRVPGIYDKGLERRLRLQRTDLQIDCRHVPVPLERGLQKVEFSEQEPARVFAAQHATWIVGSRRRNSRDAERNRLRSVIPSRFEWMLRTVQQNKDVHFGAQLYITARLRVIGAKLQVAFVVDRYFAEQIYRCVQIARSQPVFAQFDRH